MIDPFLFIFTIVAGVFFGILAVMVGIGGGLMYVPYLIFILDLGNMATLTSSMVILFTSISGTLKYRRQNRIDIKTGLIFLLISIPGIILGSYMAQRVITDVRTIKLLFGILIGITALKNIYSNWKSRNDAEEVYEPVEEESFFVQNRKIIAQNGQEYKYTVKVGIGSLLALFGGFLAGLLGVGGGIIFVPLLSSIGGVPIHIAAATSTFMIVFVTILVLGIRLSLFEGDIATVLTWGSALSIGAVIGAYIGATYAKRLESKKLLTLFWFIALLAGIRMTIG